MSSRAKKQHPAPAPSNKPPALVSQNWSGPLPPPGALAQFDQIIPNGAERILRMAEQEQAHRIETENITLGANIEASRENQKQARRGQYGGIWISSIAIIGAILSAHIGSHPTVSVALVSVPILGMVRALIGSRLDK